MRIRQRKIVNGEEYFADRMHQNQRDASGYAQLLERQGRRVHAVRDHHEGGHRGYAVFVRKEY
jgi:hypothetical protein